MRIDNLSRYTYEELKFSGWRLKLVRCGKIGICIATSADITSRIGSNQLPTWFKPLFFSTTIVGGDSSDSTGEIYIDPNGIFNWACSSTRSYAFSGNLITVLKD